MRTDVLIPNDFPPGRRRELAITFPEGVWVKVKDSYPVILRFVTKARADGFEDDGLISKKPPSPYCRYRNYELVHKGNPEIAFVFKRYKNDFDTTWMFLPNPIWIGKNSSIEIMLLSEYYNIKRDLFGRHFVNIKEIQLIKLR